MAVPCVVLASGPKKGLTDADWKTFDDGIKAFVPGPSADVELGYRVIFKEAGTQDGGNGGGGEPAGKEMFPVLGIRKRGAWDFQQYKQSTSWEERFPPPMRFQACIYFTDISKASHFLRKVPLGMKINASFSYVMIVPLSERLDAYK